eukprot:8056830-Pyramimonas_sp.AAC.1
MRRTRRDGPVRTTLETHTERKQTPNIERSLPEDVHAHEVDWRARRRLPRTWSISTVSRSKREVVLTGTECRARGEVEAPSHLIGEEGLVGGEVEAAVAKRRGVANEQRRRRRRAPSLPLCPCRPLGRVSRKVCCRRHRPRRLLVRLHSHGTVTAQLCYGTLVTAQLWYSYGTVTVQSQHSYSETPLCAVKLLEMCL